MINIPFIVPEAPNAEELLPLLKEIDDNHWYSNFGPLCLRFEKELLNCFDGDKPLFLTTVATGSAAIDLSLRALSLKKSANVLVPNFSFVASAIVVINAGLTPLYVDVDQSSWLLTPEIAKTALSTHEFSAVMPVSAFGLKCDVDEWDKFYQETGIPVVIDSAGAFGNQKVGQFTHVAFSLHATKSLGAGEGGFVISQNENLINRIRILSNFGFDMIDDLRVVSGLGLNSKLSEYHAACGLRNIQYWPQNKSKRLQIIKRYKENLAMIDGVSLPPKCEQQIMSLLPICLDKKYNIDRIEKKLTAKGIGSRRCYYPVINQHPALKDYPAIGEMPVSQQLANHNIALPVYSKLSIAEVDIVCDVFKQCLKDHA